VFTEKAPYYEEARLALICKKLYRQDLREEAFLGKSISDACYPKGDYHRMFIGEIVKALEKSTESFVEKHRGLEFTDMGE